MLISLILTLIVCDCPYYDYFIWHWSLSSYRFSILIIHYLISMPCEYSQKILTSWTIVNVEGNRQKQINKQELSIVDTAVPCVLFCVSVCLIKYIWWTSVSVFDPVPFRSHGIQYLNVLTFCLRFLSKLKKNVVAVKRRNVSVYISKWICIFNDQWKCFSPGSKKRLLNPHKGRGVVFFILKCKHSKMLGLFAYLCMSTEAGGMEWWSGRGSMIWDWVWMTMVYLSPLRNASPKAFTLSSKPPLTSSKTWWKIFTSGVSISVSRSCSLAYIPELISTVRLGNWLPL